MFSIGSNGLTLIKKFEGCKLKAYKDAVGIPTIGYGNTYYDDKTNVVIGDVITQDKANELLLQIVENFVDCVNNTIKSQINQNQFDAMVCFAYNVGCANFQKSTLLKKANLNPSDKTIADEFAKWNKAGTKVLAGLTTRRKAESDLYFNTQK